MKKQDKKAVAAKPKAAKIAGALTGPGLLAPDELDQAAGGNAGGTGRVCLVGTTARC